ncbi:hypothetical protein [Natronococcus sp.]|uniref:hypothetical protein n=1 Tax=Natronococcus sp. TaxID=35747 RepID=UPI0025E00210|nr:hypothetical protein [Natronococcus sp.]
MRRRNVIAIGGLGVLGGSGVIVGTALYGSSDLNLERTDDGTIVRKDNDQIDSFPHPITPVESDDALLGISMPDRADVTGVVVEVVWAIKRDGIWSDISVELVSNGDTYAPFSGGAETEIYHSAYGKSPSETDESTSSHLQYAYPRGTTAGRLAAMLSIQPGASGTDTEKEVEVAARLSARSLGGARIELDAPAEMIYSPEH